MSVSFSCNAIFCDDIRQEINGKMSLMGIYSVDMYVPDFPITLPKVCSFFELRIPPNLSSVTEATLVVMKGAEKINSITLALPASDEAVKIPHGKPFAYSRLIGAMEFANVSFSEPTLLEVAAQIDGQVVIGGRLWVTKFPQTEEIAVPS